MEVTKGHVVIASVSIARSEQLKLAGPFDAGLLLRFATGAAVVAGLVWLLCRI
jgi:hypothetical protein